VLFFFIDKRSPDAKHMLNAKPDLRNTLNH